MHLVLQQQLRRGTLRIGIHDGGIALEDEVIHHLFQCVEKRMGPVAILIDHSIINKWLMILGANY